MLPCRTALVLGLLCLGSAIANNCDNPSHDHSGAFSHQSNFVSKSDALQGGQLSYNDYTSSSSHLSNQGGYSTNTNGGEIYNAGTLKAEIPADAPYWWMNNPSPFKAGGNVGGGEGGVIIGGAGGCHPSAGCSGGGGGGGAAPIAAAQSLGYQANSVVTMDLSKNPFINGAFAASSHQGNINSSPSSSSLSHGNTDSSSGYDNQVQYQDQAQHQQQSGGNSPCQAGCGQSQSSQASYQQPQPQQQQQQQFSSSANNNQYANNPFLGGAVNSQQFTQTQTSSGTGSAATLDSVANYNNPLFNGIPNPGGQSSNFQGSSAFISTTGGKSGEFTSKSLTSSYNGVKSPNFGNLNADRAYLPPEEPQAPPCNGPSVCARKQICPNNVISAQQAQANNLRPSNRPCNADSEVCCSVQAPPPPPPPTPGVKRPPPPPPQPPRPTPPPTARPPPPPQRPQTAPCAGANRVCISPDYCQNGKVSQRTPANILQQIDNQPPSDKCFAPEVCCALPDINRDPTNIDQNREYLPPTSQPPRPTPGPQRPVVTRPPPTPQRPVVTRPPPTPGVKRPPPTTQGPAYLPPGEVSPQPSNESKNVLRPNRPDDTLIPQPANPSSVVIRPNDIEYEPEPPSACAAALKCVREEFCSNIGMISKSPVVLTPEQALFRVPMTSCKNVEEGFIGKCCRDPDYVDPWPVGQLGQYNPQILGFDDGSYKQKGNNGVYQDFNYDASGSCQTVWRDRLSQPRGAGPIDTGFAEIPWQAMVLLDTNRSLLCGGSIIADDAVITAASCVNQYKKNEIMIKGGEWRLGVDEEPKTFQIIPVKEISFDPRFKPGSPDHDVAILHLEDRLKFDTHIQPICIEDPLWPAEEPDEECITTGWGHEVLKIHIQNALMHVINVTSLPEKECVDKVARFGFNKNASFCGAPKADACDTDTGSGLACNIGNDYYILRGIYVTETGCGSSKNQIGTYAKIDIDWVAAAFREPGLTDYNPDPAGSENSFDFSQQGQSLDQGPFVNTKRRFRQTQQNTRRVAPNRRGFTSRRN